ncbi:DUF6188 family protein [Pseudonocardia sp. H11422]|uniref:DUF6188 family protein n=1 Tax=Pseudonocardia sp. H11422 TaxID=2835866 RepID=UPI0039777F37
MPADIRQVGFDWAVTLIVGGPDAHLVVRIEEPLLLVSGGVEHRLDPEGDPAALAPALGLVRGTGTELHALGSGQLEIRTGDGTSGGCGTTRRRWNCSGRAPPACRWRSATGRRASR